MSTSRKKGTHRSGHRGGCRRRAHVPRARRRTISRSRCARRRARRDVNRRPRHRWVFDPLDGTTNFAHGVPIFCASLALEIDGEAEVGAVYDPNRQELFTAERGVGAWLNGRRIQTSAATTSPRFDSRDRVSRTPSTKSPSTSCVCLAACSTHARAVRRLGSAAIDLCWVAAGRMEAFWEESLNPWDTRAGALIVEEAGGRVTGIDGGPWDPSDGPHPRVERACAWGDPSDSDRT